MRQNKIKILYENLKNTDSCTFVIDEGSRGYGFKQAIYHMEGRNGKHSFRTFNLMMITLLNEINLNLITLK